MLMATLIYLLFLGSSANLMLDGIEVVKRDATTELNTVVLWNGITTLSMRL